MYEIHRFSQNFIYGEFDDIKDGCFEISIDGNKIGPEIENTKEPEVENWNSTNFKWSEQKDINITMTCSIQELLPILLREPLPPKVRRFLAKKLKQQENSYDILGQFYGLHAFELLFINKTMSYEEICFNNMCTFFICIDIML